MPTSNYFFPVDGQYISDGRVWITPSRCQVFNPVSDCATLPRPSEQTPPRVQCVCAWVQGYAKGGNVLCVSTEQLPYAHHRHSIKQTRLIGRLAYNEACVVSVQSKSRSFDNDPLTASYEDIEILQMLAMHRPILLCSSLMDGVGDAQVRTTYLAATSTINELRQVGIYALEDIIANFSQSLDVDLGGTHTLLEQYQAQVTSALRPAFDASTPPGEKTPLISQCLQWVCINRVGIQTVADGSDGVCCADAGPSGS